MVRSVEPSRDQRRLPCLADFGRDVRLAIRTLRRSRSFSITVVLTLALGIGADTAVFSVMNGVLFRPLPFPDAERLVRLRQVQERTAETNIAPVRLADWDRLNVTFEGITGYYMEDVSETSGDVPERVRRAIVAPRFLAVWGMAPALGRDFTDAEHKTGGPPAVLISNRYWRLRMGRAADVLERVVRIGPSSYRVIGVMPASFLFPDRAVDLWFPSTVDSPVAQSRQATWFTGVGRLKPGVTFGEARANLDAVQTQLARQYPDTDERLRVDMTSLKDAAIGGIRRSLWLLFGGCRSCS